MEKYKSKLKSELAQAAGVSLPTFRRWLLSDQEELRQMGLPCDADESLLYQGLQHRDQRPLCAYSEHGKRINNEDKENGILSGTK